MPKDVLYIIDLQLGFLDAHKKKVDALLTNSVKAINKHKKLGHKIVLVEYIDYGETHPRILKCLKGYNNVSVVKKRTDSAASHLKKKKLVGTNCYFIGVNLGACVEQTCINLHNNERRLTIYKHATKNMYNSDEERDIAYLKEYFNINFI